MLALMLSDPVAHVPSPRPRAVEDDKSGPVLIVAAAIAATVYLSLAAWVLLAGA